MPQSLQTALICVALSTTAWLAPAARAQSQFKITSSDGSSILALDVENVPILRFEDAGNEGFILYDDFITLPGFTEFRLFPVGVLTLVATTLFPEIEIDATKTLVVGTRGPTMRYLVDSDENDAVANHIWYENSTAATGPDWRMMQLTEVTGGSLFVDGPVTQNHSFDIAETFWEAEAVEPGELVAIDPEQPAAVRPTSTASQAALIGVASTRPGFVLGGGAFSLEALRRTWGDAIADEYERRRPELELRVLAELPQLQSRAERTRSQADYEAYLAAEAPDPEQRPSAEAVRAAYETARADHETLVFDRTLQRFFKDRFASVALAGRVPVKADASFGAIRPGDYLTSSPIAGVAMRASGPGPILGTALESLSAGAGAIQVFVHRGWYGGEGVAVGPAPAARRMPDPKDREIAELKHRLATLEERLDGLALAESALARSGGFPPPAAR